MDDAVLPNPSRPHSAMQHHHDRLSSTGCPTRGRGGAAGRGAEGAGDRRRGVCGDASAAYARARAGRGVFPFLHGLEGDNAAQNMFFNAGPNSHYNSRGEREREARKTRVKVPRFRGLVWVVADEDLDLGVPTARAGAVVEDEMEFDESESDDEEEESEDDEELGMDVDDHDRVHIVDADATPPIATLDGKHMHPVHHRMPTTTTEDDVQMDIPPPTPAPTTSAASSSTSSGSAYSSTSPPPSEIPASNTNTSDSEPAAAQHQHEQEAYSSPLLTCTFKPRELLRRSWASRRSAPHSHTRPSCTTVPYTPHKDKMALPLRRRERRRKRSKRRRTTNTSSAPRACRMGSRCGILGFRCPSTPPSPTSCFTPLAESPRPRSKCSPSASSAPWSASVASGK
ncbi:hypothetical protein K438DRAFT_82063 [Mycena galopus ATCC 62051]|nr:hypothetical protein K438DRAFT_82063 [Mycena galopus ATCC 62051]